MNDHNADRDLGSALAQATQWEGGGTALWERALNQERTQPVWWRRRHAWGVAAAAALVLVSGVVVWRGIGSVRDGRTRPAVSSDGFFHSRQSREGAASTPADATKSYAAHLAIEATPPGVDGLLQAVRPELLLPQKPGLVAPHRFVVRRATLELTTRDVYAVFAKAGMVINTALGEYVEASSISGDGQDARAEVTLRVTADRLSGVLNELRGLGVVVSEQSGGQDITDQVVDIEARMRNEQRVEQELLALLTGRKDAKLEDVLRVQQELSRVREQIERMQAQRDSLGRLASLATVLLIVRHERGDEQPAVNGFEARLSRAWERGIDDLGGLSGGVVRLAVGGLPVWLLIGGAGYLGWRAWKRARARSAEEPAPSMRGA